MSTKPKFRLAIGNRVAVPVRCKLAGAERGTHVNVNFTLDMDRISQAEITAADSSKEPVTDFLVSRTHGWSGQTLVRDEADNPAPYSEEAFRALLDVPGMAVWIFRAYMGELGAQEKN